MSRIVLFGATGYTGRLTAQALVAGGAKPLLAGRSEARLQELAAGLGGELETQVADVSQPDTVAALVGEGNVLLSTVGPFARWGDPAVEAAIGAGATYIDSTGEAAFIRKVFDVYGRRAASAQCVLLTALGYDWVPGNLAGALAVKEAGERAVRVDIGYFMSGASSDSMSGGTRASAAGVMLSPSFTWRDGHIVTERSGRRVRSFLFDGNERQAVSAGTTEAFSLPAVYPQLRDVNVYLGWFGPMSRPMSWMSAGMSAVQKVPGVRSGLDSLFERFVKGSTGGPDENSRAGVRSQFIAVAYDEMGGPLSEVRISGINGYDFTARMLAWAATQASVGHVSGAGALGPVEAFGLERLEAGVAESGLTVERP